MLLRTFREMYSRPIFCFAVQESPYNSSKNMLPKLKQFLYVSIYKNESFEAVLATIIVGTNTAS